MGESILFIIYIADAWGHAHRSYLGHGKYIIKLRQNQGNIQKLFSRSNEYRTGNDMTFLCDVLKTWHSDEDFLDVWGDRDFISFFFFTDQSGQQNAVFGFRT